MKKIVLFLLVAVMALSAFAAVAESKTNETDGIKTEEKKKSPDPSQSESSVEEAEDYKKPVPKPAPVVVAEQPTKEVVLAKFTTLDANSVTTVGAVKKGDSLKFTPGTLANYYLLVFINGQWVAYKIPDGATSFNVPVDSTVCYIAGSNTPLAGAMAL
jgi:ABC-type Fe3+-hydroxamate transport system substrate-binding protein